MSKHSKARRIALLAAVLGVGLGASGCRDWGRHPGHDSDRGGYGGGDHGGDRGSHSGGSGGPQ